MREPININDSTQDMLIAMSESNPGAMRVLIELLHFKRSITIMHLAAMNIRGKQIWAAYTDFAHENLGALIRGAWERSEEMVKCVNNACLYPGFDEEAITGEPLSSDILDLSN